MKSYKNITNLFNLENLDDVIIFLQNFEKYDYILLNNLNLLNEEKIHLLYFLDFKIIVDIEKINDMEIIQGLFLNPIINGYINESKFNLDNIKTKIETQSDIRNLSIILNLSEYYKHKNIQNINKESLQETIIELVARVWRFFKIYEIKTFPIDLSYDEINDIYYNLGCSLGNIKKCRPVNDLSENYNISRDIKYIPGKNFYFASNIRQPLHNDYAYYPSDQSPDWLFIYSLEQAEYGGITSLISNKKIIEIMEKHNPDLLNRMNVEVSYCYYNENNNLVLHSKCLLNKKSTVINWNYYQIKEEFNTKNVMELKEDIFNFFEKFIMNGNMLEINKKWNKGDCIIFNDHLNLHCRSAFLGNRWLKDLGVFETKLNIH